MTWNPSLATGIASINAEHQQLINYINDVHDEAVGNVSREAVAKVLSSLIDYTVRHFALEERYFAKTGYPNTATHVAEHEKLKKQVSELRHNFSLGNATVTNELMTFLRSWLVSHIMEQDKAYVSHLKAGWIT